MEILVTIGKAILVLVAVATVVLPLVSERRNYKFIWQVCKLFRIKMFCEGYDEWGSIIKQLIKFGLVHCFVGVPLVAGIAFIILGFFYGYKYKRAFDHNTETLGYGRGAHHWSSGFNSKYIRTSFSRYRQKQKSTL